MDSPQRTEQTGWVGWIGFASIMMMIGGFLWIVVGLVAAFNDQWVVLGGDAALILDVSGWGWLHMILGVLALIGGYLLMRGSMFGRIVAVLLVSVSMIVNFVWLPVYPIWSIVIIAIDVLVLYAVIVHGKEMKDA
jgi:hypothetical protein